MALKTRLVVGIWLLARVVLAQLSVSPGTGIAANGPVNVVSIGNFENRSAQADLSRWNLVLAGVTQSLLSTAPVTLNSLTVNGGGIKNLTGTWTVNAIAFSNGLVTPQSGSRLVHTGTDPVEGNENSFVNGAFFNKRAGQHFFPIGNSDGYFPSALDQVADANTLIGMSVTNQNALLVKNPTDFELGGFFAERYWNLSVESGTLPETRLSLSDNETGDFFTLGAAVVVEAVNTGAVAQSLGSSSSSGGFVTSERNVTPTSRVFALARTTDLPVPQIKNAITPNNDGVNDFLVIDRIGPFRNDNRVTLIDRWGVIVREWVNFSGFDPINNPPDFDFTQLPVGNYICTLEYTANGERRNVRQMVTVIR